MQSFEIGETTYRNVCASFGPQSGPRIIVGAHYDSPGNSPGADDNASGTAGLIELARLLGKTPPSAHVEVVAYALEEAYFGTTKMGSSFHARYLKGSKQNVKLMICLEMIGYFRDDPGSQRYPSLLMGLLYPSRGNFIAIVGRAGEWSETRRIKAAMKRSTALPVRSVNAPFPVPGIDLSDHLSYWREGFPAVMITDTAYMRNMNYHSDGDTADTLDYGRMAMAVEGVYAAVMELAGSGTGDRGTGTGE